LKELENTEFCHIMSWMLNVCIFRLADHSFALRLESITEIVLMAALSRPPLLPSILEGFLNIAGTPIPVLRVAALLGLRQDPLELYTPLVIARGKLPLALLVRSVAGIRSVPNQKLAPLSDTSSFNDCVDGQLMVEDEVVQLLSLDRLLLEKERLTITGFREIEATRLAQANQAPS
jgi:purine-binding chemotaxis protein CheW